MLTIENLNSNTASEKHKVLAHAQTIANFFVEAIDQNDCNVKVVMGFYQELDDTINSILDLDKAFNPTEIEWYKHPKEAPLKLEDFLEEESPIESEYAVEAAIKALKDRCFDCKLSLPKVNFHNDLNFLFEKLGLQLEVFKNVFQKPHRDNFCHLAYGLQKTCIPDLIKMIAMLLTAYAAVMALRKFPSFSLNVFIKGIISALLAQVVGSINIALDMNSSGLPCLLSVLEELASKIPTNESLYEGLTEEQRGDSWIKDYVPLSIYEQNLQERVENKEITAEFAAIKLERYRKANDPVRYYTKALEEQLGAEEAVSSIFGFVNSVVEGAQGDINSYIDSILGVINFFECEGKRSGSDFTEILEYINDLNRVINMLSSLTGLFLKKALNLDLCKDERSLKDIEEILQDAVIEPLTPEDLKDIMEDFNGLEGQVTDDGLAVLLYDKPKKSMLPKLTLLGCNFREFAEAHRLDNLVKTTISNFIEDNKTKDNADRDMVFGDLVWSDFGNVVFPNKSNSETINSNKEEDKYTKYLKPINIRDKNKLSDKLNNNLITNIYPNLTDKDISGVRDVINNYFNGNQNNYFNVTNNIINNNFTFNENYYTFINKVDNVKDYTDKVIDKIEISYTPIEDTLGGFNDSLDELLDFIYNNPFKDNTDVEIESIPGVINKDDKGNLNLNSVFKNNNKELKNQQKQYSPNLTECRSVEDVMSVLNNIKI